MILYLTLRLRLTTQRRILLLPDYPNNAYQYHLLMLNLLHRPPHGRSLRMHDGGFAFYHMIV